MSTGQGGGLDDSEGLDGSARAERCGRGSRRRHLLRAVDGPFAAAARVRRAGKVFEARVQRRRHGLWSCGGSAGAGARLEHHRVSVPPKEGPGADSGAVGWQAHRRDHQPRLTRQACPLAKPEREAALVEVNLDSDVDSLVEGLAILVDAQHVAQQLLRRQPTAPVPIGSLGVESCAHGWGSRRARARSDHVHHRMHSACIVHVS